MAFSYTFEENFESGGIGNFNSETDGNGVLNILSFREVAGKFTNSPMPFRGAYVMETDLNGNDTTSHQYLEELAGFDISANATLFIRFVFFVTDDLVMAASDRFTIFTLQSGTVSELRDRRGTGPFLTYDVPPAEPLGVVEEAARKAGFVLAGNCSSH